MGSPAPTFKKFIKILFRMCVFRVSRTGERIQGGAGFAWGALVWRALTRIPAPGTVGLPGLKLKPCHAPYSRDYARCKVSHTGAEPPFFLTAPRRKSFSLRCHRLISEVQVQRANAGAGTRSQIRAHCAPRTLCIPGTFRLQTTGDPQRAVSRMQRGGQPPRQAFCRGAEPRARPRAWLPGATDSASLSFQRAPVQVRR